MDFTIPQELQDLRASFATFLERVVRPVEESVQAEFWAGSPDRDAIAEAADRVQRASAAEGFFAAHMPSSVGGQDVSTLGMTLLVEDAARSGLRLGMLAVSPPNPSGPTPMLLALPPHLVERYVPSLVAAESSMCFALTEPEAGSDAQAIRTHAERADGGWRINGHKHYITNGDKADVAVVFAVTDAEKRAAGGITAFLVPSDQFRRGPVQYTMADTHPSELFFEDAWVADDHVLGEVGAGFFLAMSFLNAGRAYIGAQALGLAEFSLDASVDHAKARKAFGRPISRYQAVSFPLAEAKADIEAIRWLVYHLAWCVDEGQSPMLDASIVKYYATEKACKVADTAVQTFGGMGLLREGPVERVLRHLRMLRVVEGATGIQQLVIARSLGL